MDEDKIKEINNLTEEINDLTKEIAQKTHTIHELSHPDRQKVTKTKIDGGIFQLVNAKTVCIENDLKKIREILEKKEKNW